MASWVELNYDGRMMGANDNGPTSKLRIEADHPDAGDQVCMAIWPGPIHETDREGAFKIGLELLEKALGPEGPLVELRIIEPGFPATFDELRKFILDQVACFTTCGRRRQLALKILRVCVVHELEKHGVCV